MNENFSKSDLDRLEEYIDDLNHGRSSDVFEKIQDKELLGVLKAARDMKARAADDEIDQAFSRNLRNQILQEAKGQEREVHQTGSGRLWRWFGFTLGTVGIMAAVLGVALVVTDQKNTSGTVTTVKNTNTKNENVNQPAVTDNNQNTNGTVNRNQGTEIVQITNSDTPENQTNTNTTVLPDGTETLAIAGGENIEDDVVAASSVEIPIGSYELTQAEISIDVASIESTVNEVDQWIADPVYAQLEQDTSQIKL